MKAIILAFLIGTVFVNSQALSWIGDYYVLYPCDPKACCCPSLNTKVSIAKAGSNIVLNGDFPENAVCNSILVKPDNGVLQFPWTSTSTVGSNVTDPDTDFNYSYTLSAASTANPVSVGSVSLTTGNVGNITSVQTGAEKCTFVLMQAPNNGQILSVLGALIAVVVMIMA